MASDELKSEIERAERVGAMLTSVEDKAVLERYISDLLRRVNREPRRDRLARLISNGAELTEARSSPISS